MGDPMPYSAPPGDLSASESGASESSGRGSGAEYEEGEEGEINPMRDGAEKPVPLQAAAPKINTVKPLLGNCHKTGEHPPGLYIPVNACSKDTHHYAGKTFLRIRYNGVSPSDEFPYKHFDAVTNYFAELSNGKEGVPQVFVTNPAHHICTRPSKIDFGFNVGAILGAASGTPVDARHAVMCPSMNVLHTGATELPFDEAFDLRAAAASLRRGDEGSTSGSQESADERNHSARVFNRFAYGKKGFEFDAAMAARAVMQPDLPSIKMEKVMLVNANLVHCSHNEPRFPYPLRFCMKGVKSNLWTGSGKCAALLMPDGHILTASGAGALTLMTADCSPKDLASFVGMDPEREIETIFSQEAWRDSGHRDKYYLTPMMQAFVKFYIMPAKSRKYRKYKHLQRALAQKGLFINDESNTTFVCSASPQGLTYLLGKGHALRASMPMYNPDSMVATVEPDVPGGWSGLAEAVARDGYSAGLLAASFRVHVALELKFVSPNAQYERVEAFARSMRALELIENPPPVFVAPSAPPAAPVVVVPESLRSFDSKIAFALAAAQASSGSVKQTSGGGGRRSHKKGRGRKE